MTFLTFPEFRKRGSVVLRSHFHVSVIPETWKHALSQKRSPRIAENQTPFPNIPQFPFPEARSKRSTCPNHLRRTRSKGSNRSSRSKRSSRDGLKRFTIRGKKTRRHVSTFRQFSKGRNEREASAKRNLVLAEPRRISGSTAVRSSNLPKGFQGFRKKPVQSWSGRAAANSSRSSCFSRLADIRGKSLRRRRHLPSNSFPFGSHCVCHGTVPVIPPHAFRSLLPLARIRCALARARRPRRAAACSSSGLRSSPTPGG